MTEEKKDSLLARAKKVPAQGGEVLHMSEDLIELVYAFLRNELTPKQVLEVLVDAGYIKTNNPTSQNAWPIIARVAQHMVMDGLLVPGGWLK